jgi:hypothetical protein
MQGGIFDMDILMGVAQDWSQGLQLEAAKRHTGNVGLALLMV